jgi:hypothetical protein
VPAKSCPSIILPKDWAPSVKSALLRVISLAQLAIAYTRAWAANCPNARIRLKARLDRAQQEIALLREQMRINNVRMELIPPHRRPHYPPQERMAILELKAARGWSLKQTAKAFLVTSATIASWMKRLDEDGPHALVQVPQPVNRFPDFVCYVVQQLKTLCPTLGKALIAKILSRAGLHLGTTTVGRMLKRKRRPITPTAEPEPTAKQRIVTAKYPGHVWHVDLTVVPTGLGFWVPWLPLSLPQSWPFCHWLVLVVDHFSRRVMGCTAFPSQPTSQQVRAFLGRTMAKANSDPPARKTRAAKPWKTAPKYIICDRGKQLDCPGFRAWCTRAGIKPPRYGAIGKHGSLAVVERAILTIKRLLACLLLVPYRREAFLRELACTIDWYNKHRPHTWLNGRTPDGVYYGKFPANRKPRFEPRACWPRRSPCARPWALVRGSPGARLTVEVSFHKGKRHLPIVTIKRAA